VCENLVKTYRKRLTSVIANKGYTTMYWDKLLLLTKYLFSTIICKYIFFKWENLHNWWLTKYFFCPTGLPIGIYSILFTHLLQIWNIYLNSLPSHSMCHYWDMVKKLQ
jgi:hypothetical protein